VGKFGSRSSSGGRIGVMVASGRLIMGGEDIGLPFQMLEMPPRK